MERTVTGYFDYIEDLIERENAFTMEEFEKSVNVFLEFRQYKILPDNGRVSHKQALDKAYGEYEIFNQTQPIESDFDKIMKKLKPEDLLTPEKSIQQIEEEQMKRLREKAREGKLMLDE